MCAVGCSSLTSARQELWGSVEEDKVEDNTSREFQMSF